MEWELWWQELWEYENRRERYGNERFNVEAFEIKSELRIRFSIPIVEQVVEQVVIGIRKYYVRVFF